jgi:O-methyltransferase domain
MSAAPRKRRLATEERRVVKGHERTSNDCKWIGAEISIFLEVGSLQGCERKLLTMSAAPEQTDGPAQRMGGLLMGHFAAECVHAVAVLGIADLLASGHTTIVTLASATGCHAPSLERVLRVLVRFGVFVENAPGLFELTPVGATLRSDVPDSLRSAAIFAMSAPIWASCGTLLDSLRRGEPSFVGLHNATVYQYLPKHPELWAVFNNYMTTQSNLHNAAIVDAYDFSGMRTLVDVGGGHGATLAAVLRRYPTMKGILFDLPEVVIDSARLETSKFSNRCEIIGGDMLRSVPAGGDAYMIKRVMMDKIDRDAETILRNCLSVMNGAAKILVVDPMLPAGTDPHPNWLTDIFMMVTQGGRCRTEADFRNLFNAAGLRMTQVIATRSPNFILEGRASC